MSVETNAALYSKQAFVIHLLMGQKASKLLKFRGVPAASWHNNVADLCGFGSIRNE